MDLRFTDAENAFREDVRAFIRTALPAGLRAKVRAGRRISRDETVAWQKLLNQQGYAVPHWPVEHGGRDWTPVQRYILREEMDCAPAPPLIALGINLVAPVIIAFGNDAQKARFLPPIANSDEWWAQGFSEPGAGSDLASLRTSARCDGDHYIVSGEKTWTSHAQYADWIFCLVRTDPAVAKLIRAMMDDEITPTLHMPSGTDLDGYKSALIERFRNPALKHRTWQIAMDGSQKLPQRLLGTIRDRLKSGAPIDRLALGVAGWMRYVSGTDEKGAPIDVRDPLAAKLASVAAEAGPTAARLAPALLAMGEIFGTDLPVDPRFTTPVIAALESLFAKGAARTVASA